MSGRRDKSIRRQVRKSHVDVWVGAWNEICENLPWPKRLRMAWRLAWGIKAGGKK